MTNAKALIVEDEIFVALDLERILADRGYDVVGIAADRAEAMEHAGECSIAFVDVNLRDGRTGPDIGRTLLEDHQVSVVFVTANPEQLGSMAQRAVTCVQKPFRDDLIVAAAAMACGRPRAA